MPSPVQHLLTQLSPAPLASPSPQAATSAPLIERSIERATGIVYNITGGKDLTLQEVNRVSEVVTSLADPSANVIFGAVIDDAVRGATHVAGVVTCVHACCALLCCVLLCSAVPCRAQRSQSSHWWRSSADIVLPACLYRLQYEGEIHVTIIATGFSQTFEENLWGGKSSTVSSTGSSTGSRGSTSGTRGYRTLEWPRDPPLPPAGQQPQQQAPLQQQPRGPGRDALSGNGWGAALPRGGRPDRRGW